MRYRGGIYVGGGIYFGRTYAAPPPPLLYDCYGCNSSVPAYYTRPTPPPPAPAPVVATPVPYRPPVARLGLGVFAGQTNFDGVEGDDLGLLARYYLSRSWAVEAELARTQQGEDGVETRRVGAGLMYDLSARSKLSPFVVASMGSWDDRRYGEVGVGLTYRLSRSLEIGADVRSGLRCFACEEDTQQPLSVGDETEDGERYTRGRLSAILRF